MAYIWDLFISGAFYLCQALQNVTEKGVKANRKFRIRWLEIDSAPNIYAVSYDDLLEPLTVIGEVLYFFSKQYAKLLDETRFNSSKNYMYDKSVHSPKKKHKQPSVSQQKNVEL